MNTIMNRRITSGDGTILEQAKDWMLRHWQDVGVKTIAEVTYNGQPFQEIIKNARCAVDVWAYVNSHCKSKDDNIRLAIFQYEMEPPESDPRVPIIKSLFNRRKVKLT